MILFYISGLLAYFIPRHKHDIVHKTGAQYPEECYHILSRYFIQYHSFLRVPTLTEYANWVYGLTFEEFVEIYQYYKQELQVIGFGGKVIVKFEYSGPLCTVPPPLPVYINPYAQWYLCIVTHIYSDPMYSNPYYVQWPL